MKRNLSFLLAILFLASCVPGCGYDSEKQTESTSGQDSDVTTAEQADEYNYPKLDLGGQDFVFLVPSDASNMYHTIDVAEQNGDLLDDAVWKRNIFIEDKYNMNIVEKKSENDVNSDIQLAVNSGDNVYQAAYPLTNTLGSMVLGGMFWDLNKGSGFNFDREWWDQAVMEDVKIGDDKAVYFANSDLSLLNFEATWCMYFNRRMVEDLQVDMPYQTVRDGNLTFDELYKYISAGANLNGDESYNWDKDGKCVYGFTSMGDFITQCYVSSDEKQIKFENGEPTLMVGSDRFYQVTDKLKKIFGERGTTFFSNNKDNGSHYELVFGAGRAMFTACEIKGGNGGGVFSEMVDDYGIVPMPKFDASQKNYISPIAVWTYFLTVPVSNPDIETASIVLDTMSYLSYRDIVPIYYDVVLQVKHIRDEKTSEMLDIIRSTRTYFTAYAFGFGAKIRNELISYISYDVGDAASIIASYKDSTIAEMDKAMETFNSK